MTVKKTLALLVLLCRSGPLPRERVVVMLWPQLDESSGRRKLWRELAQYLGPLPQALLRPATGSRGLR